MFASPEGFAHIYLIACSQTLLCVCSQKLHTYIDMESHVEMVKSGRSVHRAMLSMRSTQYKTCTCRKRASYAICMRICALVMSGKALFTDILWAGSV